MQTAAGRPGARRSAPRHASAAARPGGAARSPAAPRPVPWRGEVRGAGRSRDRAREASASPSGAARRGTARREERGDLVEVHDEVRHRSGVSLTRSARLAPAAAGPGRGTTRAWPRPRRAEVLVARAEGHAHALERDGQAEPPEGLLGRLLQEPGGRHVEERARRRRRRRRVGVVRQRRQGARRPVVVLEVGERVLGDVRGSHVTNWTAGSAAATARKYALCRRARGSAGKRVGVVGLGRRRRRRPRRTRAP